MVLTVSFHNIYDVKKTLVFKKRITNTTLVISCLKIAFIETCNRFENDKLIIEVDIENILPGTVIALRK